VLRRAGGAAARQPPPPPPFRARFTPHTPRACLPACLPARPHPAHQQQQPPPSASAHLGVRQDGGDGDRADGGEAGQELAGVDPPDAGAGWCQSRAGPLRASVDAARGAGLRRSLCAAQGAPAAPGGAWAQPVFNPSSRAAWPGSARQQVPAAA
jgi:hypothetical protein